MVRKTTKGKTEVLNTQSVPQTRTSPELIRWSMHKAVETLILLQSQSGDLDQHTITTSCQSFSSNDQ